VVAIETVGFYRWLWDLLEPVCDKLVLADATQCRALAGRRLKTDREDALNVAELLSAGRCPLAWAPDSAVAELRSRTRQRNRLSRWHAKVLHVVKGVLNAINFPGPARADAAALHRWLEASHARLADHHRVVIEDAVDQLVMIERQIERAERAIERIVQCDRFKRIFEILDSIPGVALVAGATILAEVGDFKRFPDRRAIACYAGLTPRVFNSADTVRHGRISKAGPRELRWTLQQVAWTIIRDDGHTRGMFVRISKRAGRKKAAVAIARRVLVWAWTIVRKDQLFKRKGVEQNDSRACNATGIMSKEQRRKRTA
jgi:transposase